MGFKDLEKKARDYQKTAGRKAGEREEQELTAAKDQETARE